MFSPHTVCQLTEDSVQGSCLVQGRAVFGLLPAHPEERRRARWVKGGSAQELPPCVCQEACSGFRQLVQATTAPRCTRHAGHPARCGCWH